MSIARMYIELEELYAANDKTIYTDNIERLYGYADGERGYKSGDRNKVLMQVTGATTSATLRAWLSRGRNNVKMPLVKLCHVAEYVGVDIRDLISQPIAPQRDFLSVDTRRRDMYRRLKEVSYYNNGEWHLLALVQDMDKLEDNADDMQLIDDCAEYLKIITNLKTGVVIARVREIADEYCKTKRAGK